MSRPQLPWPALRLPSSFPVAPGDAWGVSAISTHVFTSERLLAACGMGVANPDGGVIVGSVLLVPDARKLSSRSPSGGRRSVGSIQ